MLLTSLRPHRQMMMTEVEQQFLFKLPNAFKIYRGCIEGLNEGGLSWTLDKSRAEFFANRFGKHGIVKQRTINKPEIIAYLNGRSEQEIIIRPIMKHRNHL